MRLTNRRGWLGMVVLMAAACFVIGCNQTENKGGEQQAKAKTDTLKKAAAGEEDHGWWCDEHGIPEHMCGLCNKSYRDKKKAEGDWCEDHRRLKSQCFKCDPSLYEKVFEPMYVAQFGKKPERPPEKEFTK